MAGPAAKTAEWMTNVGKEHGQILVSVMTAKERSGLSKMALSSDTLTQEWILLS